MSRGSNPDREKEIFLYSKSSISVVTPHPASYSISNSVPFREQTHHVTTLSTHNRLASGLRISGAVHFLTSVVMWSEGLSNRVSIIVKRYIDHMHFAAYMTVSFITCFVQFFWFYFLSLYIWW